MHPALLLYAFFACIAFSLGIVLVIAGYFECRVSTSKTGAKVATLAPVWPVAVLYLSTVSIIWLIKNKEDS